MKRSGLLQHFTALGCELLREGARHSWWRHTVTEKRSAIPRHTEINDHPARQNMSRPQGSRTREVLAAWIGYTDYVRLVGACSGAQIFDWMIAV